MIVFRQIQCCGIIIFYNVIEEEEVWGGKKK